MTKWYPEIVSVCGPSSTTNIKNMGTKIFKKPYIKRYRLSIILIIYILCESFFFNYILISLFIFLTFWFGGWVKYTLLIKNISFSKKRKKEEQYRIMQNMLTSCFRYPSCVTTVLPVDEENQPTSPDSPDHAATETNVNSSQAKLKEAPSANGAKPVS